jgi:hypothetical protein
VRTCSLSLPGVVTVIFILTSFASGATIPATFPFLVALSTEFINASTSLSVMTSWDCANELPDNTSSREKNNSEEKSRGFMAPPLSAATGWLLRGRRTKLKVSQTASALPQKSLTL